MLECSGDEIIAVLDEALKSEPFTVIVVKVESGNEKVGPIPINPVIIRERFRAQVRAS